MSTRVGAGPPALLPCAVPCRVDAGSRPGGPSESPRTIPGDTIRTSGSSRTALTVGSALAPAAVAASSEAPTPPANDEVANAQAIHSLPATVEGTTVGATTVTSEPGSGCVGGTVASVWYSLHTTSAERVAVELAAGGTLDGTVDVYKAVRSQLEPVACAQTEEEGKASLSFKAKKNTIYDIRVAALPNSQLAGFTLNVFQPTPAVAPPGPRLPAGGVSGQVDRIQNINAAYSVSLHAGVSYLINLANETQGGCVSGALFPPGTTLLRRRLRALARGLRRLPAVHPRPGQGRALQLRGHPEPRTQGRAALSPAGRAGEQHADRAGAARSATTARASGRLEGTGIQVLRLYRVDVDQPLQPDAEAERADRAPNSTCSCANRTAA